jgi:hypothetical protein
MNQIMLGATVSLLLIGGVTACTILEKNAPPSESMARINLPRCSLGAAKSTGDCTVKVFDGNALAAAQHGERGEWFISVPIDSVTGPRIAIYSAPGYEPQIQVTKITVRDDEQIVLKAKSDSRGGYLTGVVFKKTEEKMADGACGIENFLANKPVVINRVRARFTTSTDNIGSFEMALPAGRYSVQVEGQSREVDVPNDDTLFVVIPVN